MYTVSMFLPSYIILYFYIYCFIIFMQVIAVCRENKSEQVKAYGAGHSIDYTTQNIRQEVKKLAPSGVDIVFDAVGGDAATDLVKRYVNPF